MLCSNEYGAIPYISRVVVGIENAKSEGMGVCFDFRGSKFLGFY
jgi:hypothetical protein